MSFNLYEKFPLTTVYDNDDREPEYSRLCVPSEYPITIGFFHLSLRENFNFLDIMPQSIILGLTKIFLLQLDLSQHDQVLIDYLIKNY